MPVTSEARHSRDFTNAPCNVLNRRKAMTQSVLLVVVTAVVTWLLLRWTRTKPHLAKLLSLEEKEAGRAKDIGVQLDGARDRASDVEVERNKLALAKAVKAALWVTDSRLNEA